MTMRRTRAVRAGALALFLCAGTARPGSVAEAPPGGPAASDTSALPTDIAGLRNLIVEGRYDDAEAGARALLKAIDPDGNGESVAIAQALDLVLDARGRSTRAADAETRAGTARAARMWERLVAGEPLPGGETMPPRDRVASLAASLQLLCASRVLVSSEYSEARGNCARSLELRRGLDPPDPKAQAESAFSYGVLLRRLGEYEAARPLLEESLQGRVKAFGENSRETSQSLNSLGNLLAEMGLYTEARAAFERCLAIREAIFPAGHHNIGTTLNNLGTLQWMAGDLPAAQRTLERALEVRRKALGPDHQEYALTLENLSNVLYDFGDYAESRRLLEEAIPILEKKLGPEDVEVAAALDNLSIVLDDLGESAASRQAIERSIAIKEKSLPADHPDTANARAHLANRLRNAGDLEGSRALFEQAIAVLDSGKPGDPRDLAFALGDYALLLGRVGDQDGARAALRRAISIREGFAGPLDTLVVDYLVRLAQVERAAGNAGAALDGALDASARMRENLAATVRVLPERQALRYEASRGRAVDLALTILGETPSSAPTRTPRPATPTPAAAPADSARAWDAVVHARALVLDEMARRHAVALQSKDPDVAALLRDLEAARGELANLILRGARKGEAPKGMKEPIGEAVRRVAGEKERLEQALGVKSAQFRRERDAQRAGLAESTGWLQSGDALVAFVHYRDPGPAGQMTSATPASYAAFVQAGPTGAPAFVRLGEAQAIDAAIAAWRERVAVPPEDDAAERAYRQAALVVRRALWDPVAGKIGKAKRVFFVPDGAIQAVSFATLPASEGAYLLEKGPLFHYLAAERDLVRGPAAAPGLGAGLLAMGGPDFDAVGGDLIAEGTGGGGPGTTRGVPRKKAPVCPDLPDSFAPLPNASKEVEEIVSLYGRRKAGGKDAVTTLAGAAAGEAALREAAPGRRIVHLATHAFVADERCAEKPEMGVNPLLLSGLALAGANRRGDAAAEIGLDDGLLTAEEIASLDLRGVEWVVLSACETGIGPVQSGEGVLGLRRSFQVAGAASLILTLWKVDDIAARVWVRDLYDAHLSGKGTAESIRAASARRLAALRKAGVYDHPFSWGAFVATGDWR